MGQKYFETSLLVILLYWRQPNLQYDELKSYLKTCTRCAWHIFDLLDATCSSKLKHFAKRCECTGQVLSVENRVRVCQHIYYTHLESRQQQGCRKSMKKKRFVASSSASCFCLLLSFLLQLPSIQGQDFNVTALLAFLQWTLRLTARLIWTCLSSLRQLHSPQSTVIKAKMMLQQ